MKEADQIPKGHSACIFSPDGNISICIPKDDGSGMIDVGMALACWVAMKLAKDFQRQAAIDEFAKEAKHAN